MMQMEQLKSSAQNRKRKCNIFLWKKIKLISEITLCTNVPIMRVPWNRRVGKRDKNVSEEIMSRTAKSE